jgi:hypothetical protein
MGEQTGISWCHHTFNPWIGCTKVSPACDGCYAEAMMGEAGRYKRVVWGKPGAGAGTRARTSPANWRQPLKWNRAAQAAGEQRLVFCASLADVFDNRGAGGVAARSLRPGPCGAEPDVAAADQATAADRAPLRRSAPGSTGWGLRPRLASQRLRRNDDRGSAARRAERHPSGSRSIATSYPTASAPTTTRPPTTARRRSLAAQPDRGGRRSPMATSTNARSKNARPAPTISPRLRPMPLLRRHRVWSYALRLAGWPDDRPVWTGSCPCGPFSVAGKKLGFADPRHLWPEWFRLIGECRPDRALW